MEELKALVYKRGTIKATVTRFKSFLGSFHGGTNIGQLKARLAKCENSYAEFMDIQDKIEVVAPEKNQEHEAEREAFEELYYECVAQAELELKRQEPTPTLSANSNDNSGAFTQSAVQIKLPTISLPTYSGDPEQWSLFKETFTSLIDNNAALDVIQKFQYLRASLSGEALGMISSLELSVHNYGAAWDLLQKRYTNLRVLVNSHARSIVDYPVMAKESYKLLRQLLDNTQKHIRALDAFQLPTQHWDGLLVYIICSKFDDNTRREWELNICKKPNEELATMTELTDFLQQRCQFLQTVEKPAKVTFETNSRFTSNSGHKSNSPSRPARTYVTQNSICTMCSGKHQLYACGAFKKLSIGDRRHHVEDSKLCYNCLGQNHIAAKCELSTCRRCKRKHNTLLHLEERKVMQSRQSVASDDSDSEQEAAVSTSVSTHTSITTASNSTMMRQSSRSEAKLVVLSTAIIRVYDYKGNAKHLRCLLDSGSQSNFISQEACDILGVRTSETNIPVCGISGAVTRISKEVDITIHSTHTDFNARLKFLVIRKITDHMPMIGIDHTQVKIPSGIQLADPSWHQSSKVDMLIGAELFYKILCVGQIQLTNSSPTCQKTQFGWVISGNVVVKQRQRKTTCHLVKTNLQDMVQRFWEIEEVAYKPCYSQEEWDCERHFVETHTRDKDGRFTVRLPFKANLHKLGQSRHIAQRRFESMERKLARDPQLQVQYKEFMREYERLGHMEKVVYSEIENGYYLPHHAVLKEESLTTKLRVVFDGSAATTSGISLNDVLMKGPTIQDNLVDIILRFRTHNIAITADISKMYRQVNVDTRDTDYQLILWRNQPENPLDTYRLKTVTYGTTPAPFLAIRCLKQLASDESMQMPVPSNILTRDFYVDDVLTGAKTIEQAIQLKNELRALLLKSGFELHKWRSNCAKVIEEIGGKGTEQSSLEIDKNITAKTLGLIWNSRTDEFKVSVPNTLEQARVTKRSILSAIAQIFDPLGLVGPVNTTAKLIMQNLWQTQVQWDDHVPESIHTTWINFYSQLTKLASLHIPRKVLGDGNCIRVELHGFCDASEVAYGAVIYLRSTNTQGQHSTQLLCSKSRVAPIRSISLPRLELCGALLLAQLTRKVKSAMHLTISECNLWTDSTIVLSWISSPPASWKTFVSNRIGEIQEHSNIHDWHHVSTTDNPADILSRGSDPDILVKFDNWWRGPQWLSLAKASWPTSTQNEETHDQVENERRKVATTTLTILDSSDEIFNRFSSYRKLKRVVAYCLRFRHNACNREHRHIGPLSVEELQGAEMKLVKIVQAAEFERELKDLRDKQQVHTKSRILALSPFLDEAGLMRVGGRLKNSDLSYASKHPILLPARHKFTLLIINHTHVMNLHAGAQSVLASIRTRFWPLSARSVIRGELRKCMRCFRAKPTPMQHYMGDLPRHRVIPSKPFLHTGVDYCGPMNIKECHRRGRVAITKCYVALFVCFSTKAVHLELVSNLTTEGFLSALRRFIARRGRVDHIYSDNATNFIGANNELQKLHEFLTSEQTQPTIINTLADNNTTWHFIPPRAPHFGGLWESAVKSAKYHITRVIGKTLLTFEEYSTLLAQIESCLNSRPLLELSNDPRDLSTLTPAHFLHGDSLSTGISDPDLSHLPINKLSRWQHIQKINQDFWKQWSKTYLHQLQQRTKWKVNGISTINIGVLVLLMEDNLPPMNWILGRIIALHPGADGVVRVVTVKTQAGTYKRSITKLCLVPINDESA